ncbi:MAG: hypothetical protein LUE65_11865 [Clostridiales bacterium]|nr:hypothetical protein [Clostridiales bacterium]
MTDEERYLWMIEKLSQKQEAIALKIVKRERGLVECTNMVQQFLYFGKGCAYVAWCFNEITREQYNDLKKYLSDSVAQLNKLICKSILHEDVPEPGN